MKKPAAIGIDVGSTKTLCVLVNKHSEQLEEVKFKTAPEEGRNRFTHKLRDAVGALVTSARAKGLEVAASASARRAQSMPMKSRSKLRPIS